MLVNLTAIETTIIVTGTGQAALDQLALTALGPPKRKCLIVPGLDIAWDECECGQFAQTLIAEYLTNDPFDGGATTVGNGCGTSYRVISVASSIARCIPTLDANGRPPSCDKYLTAGVHDIQDRTALRSGILCHLQSLLDTNVISYYQIGQQTPLGEQGGCAGSVLVWSVAVPNRCPC